MKTNLKILSLLLTLAVSSCESPENEQSNEDELIEIDSDFGSSKLEEMNEDYQGLVKDLTQLKNQDQELNVHDYDAFQPEIGKMENKLDSMRTIVDQFASLNKANQEQMAKNFYELQESVVTQIGIIKERFNDLKKLDT